MVESPNSTKSDHFSLSKIILQTHSKHKHLFSNTFCIFSEYKHKENIIDNRTDDTIEYDYVNTFIYRPEKNGPGLTGDEVITIAHPMIMAMILAINVER